jgi:hypothetical protein
MIQEQAEQYLTDADGNKIAVVIDIATYQKCWMNWMNFIASRVMSKQ